MGQEHSIADGAYPVALSGRVYCWVDATESPVDPGDLLTSSSTPGHAMKVNDHSKANGAILGKALEPFAGPGTGMIEVLVSVK